ncbi:glycosyltransferase family 2 protein [Cadophora sp. DSE1049]|nr:glycosyltransferase family 2 protein [Cadophora sp. DSE1049]
MMDQPEEIALNYLADNPLVAIYNAEPTWQSGFLKVGHHLISISLGLAWLILRLILMLIIWIWNNATFYFPKAQLPDAEQWPAAFARGLQKLKSLPILRNSRLVIFLLVVLAILYVLVSLNMPFCLRVVAILQNRRTANITSPVSDTPRVRPGSKRIFAEVKRETWHDRIIDRLMGSLVLIDNINRRIVAFVTSQGLKVVLVMTAGLVLTYRAYRWMGSPMTILVEPNYMEWGSFMGAIRLNLYRARSLDFLVNAVFITFAVHEYGFKPIAIALGSLLTLFVAYLAQAMSFMDRNSEEWHRAASTRAQWAIPEHEGLATYITGLLIALPFLYLLSRQAKRAYRKWLMVPQGRISGTLLALLMVIPNLVVTASNRLSYHLGYRFSPMDSPVVLSRRNSSIDTLSPVFYPTVESAEYETTPPRTPITPPRKSPRYENFVDEDPAPRIPVTVSRQSPRYDTFVEEDPAPRTPITPIRPTDLYQTFVAEDPALPTSPPLSEVINSIVREVVDVIIDLFRTVGSTVQGRLLIAFLMCIPVLSLLAFLAPKRPMETNTEALSPSIFGWVSRAVFSIGSYTSETLGWVLESLSSAFPTLENGKGSIPYGTSPIRSRPSTPLPPSEPFTSPTPYKARVSIRPSSYSKSWNASFLWSLVNWVPERLGFVSTAYTDLLYTVVTYLEGRMGKHTMNTMFLAIIGTFTWVVGGFVDSLRISFWPGATYLAFLSLPVNIIVYQLTSYLAQSGFLGIDVEDSIYLILFGVLLLLRLLKNVVHYRRSDSFAKLNSTSRPAVYRPSDVTVVIPTRGEYFVEDTPEAEENDEFLQALGTILENNPAEVVLATSGLEAHKKLNVIAAHFGTHRVKVTPIHEPERNLRHQFLNATNGVATDIICYAHSNVRWNTNFLKESLKPFNNPEVGLVGVPVNMARLYSIHSYLNAKDYRIPHLELKPDRPLYPDFTAYYVKQKLIRFKDWLIVSLTNLFLYTINIFLIDHTFSDHGLIYSLMNFRECVYYRHYNHISTSTSSIDNGLELASAKSALVRTSILQSPDFRFNFPHEKVIGLLPVFGGMRTDAAHFITRKVRELGYKSAFQPTAPVQCNFPVRNDGLIAYAHMVRNRYSAAYRSNLASLKSGIWLQSPWTAYTLLLSLFHIPMVSDLGLACLLWLARVDKSFIHFYGLVVLAYRYRVRASHWERYPRDRAWIVAEPVFWFVESIIQIAALGLAFFPEAEPEECHVNIGFKGNWDNNRGVLR